MATLKSSLEANYDNGQKKRLIEHELLLCPKRGDKISLMGPDKNDKIKRRVKSDVQCIAQTEDNVLL